MNLERTLRCRRFGAVARRDNKHGLLRQSRKSFAGVEVANSTVRLFLVMSYLSFASSAFAENLDRESEAVTRESSDQWVWNILYSGPRVVDFPARLRTAADALPAVGEGLAGVLMAEARTQQERSGAFPLLGFSVSSADTFGREFKRQSTTFESLVPRRRTDAVGSVNQLLLDWGATSARIRSGRANADSARARYELARVDGILALGVAWHEAIAAAASVELTRGHAARLRQLVELVGSRADAGVESLADRARAEASASLADSRLRDAERRTSAAHARLVELWGALPLPPARALPPPDVGTVVEPPAVRAARSDTQALTAAARAAKSDRLPRLEARVTGSVFDIVGAGRPDFDLRATLSLTTRFSIGGAESARVAELSAQTRQAELAAIRLGAENARELAEAEADLAARKASLPAQRRAAIAAFQALRLFGLRFGAARGTLFDLLVAEREALDAGLALADAEIGLDAARWLILARRGTLLDVIDGPSTERPQ